MGSPQREILTQLDKQLTRWQQSIDDPVLKDAY